MRRKCFTLVELLVVIGIIAVLMGILLPALSAVKRTAQRVVCGANLAGIGKALLAYANDYGGDYPRAGNNSSTTWGNVGEIESWTSQVGKQYGLTVTITSSLYLLVKWEDVTPGQFVCKGDSGTKEFKLSDAKGLPAGVDDPTDVWDFGGKAGYSTVSADGKTGWPGQYNSYAYHSPYASTTTGASFPLNANSNPASPVCADRNPYLDKNSRSFLDGKGNCYGLGDKNENYPSCDDTSGYKDDSKTGNTACHQQDGQNILFNDTHVRFEKYPNVGISKDNIWKCWTHPPVNACDRELTQSPYCSTLPTEGNGKGAPYSEEDAYLVSETNYRP